jgi:hypothetical protein
VASERIRTGEEFSTQAFMAARRLLVQSVGKLLRWRLHLSNERVRKRLAAAIDGADELLPELMRSSGYDIKDAWPEGFRAAAQQALGEWDEMSGESTRKPPKKPEGGGWGGVKIVEIAEQEDRDAGRASAEVGLLP